MGEAKKKGRSQIEKAQSSQNKASSAKKRDKVSRTEKKEKAIEVPDIDDQRLTKIREMGVVTPFSIATQFNIRVGTAKDLIQELVRRKVIECVGGNGRIRVYRIAVA